MDPVSKLRDTVSAFDDRGNDVIVIMVRDGGLTWGDLRAILAMIDLYKIEADIAARQGPNDGHCASCDGHSCPSG